MQNSFLHDDPCYWAVVFVSPTSSGVESNGAIATNAQLIRTANYCEKNGLIIENVFISTGNNGLIPFGSMTNFIRSRNYKVAVVADTAHSLFSHDFAKVSFLQSLYQQHEIEIHLVKEKIILSHPYNSEEARIWANIRQVHAEYQGEIPKGIDLTADFIKSKRQKLRSTKGEQHV